MHPETDSESDAQQPVSNHKRYRQSRIAPHVCEKYKLRQRIVLFCLATKSKDTTKNGTEFRIERK